MRKLTILSSIVLFVIIFLSGFAQLIFDEEFYLKEHEKNNVPLRESTEMTDNLISYLQGKADLIFFNEREREHLEDVKNLVFKGFIVHFSLIALFLVLLVFLYDKDFTKNLSKILTISSLIVIGFSVVSFVLSKYFNYFFIKFHHIFFDNDLWLLDPETDMLILLLPEQFFVDFVFNVFLRILTMALIMLGFAFMLSHGSRQKQV